MKVEYDDAKYYYNRELSWLRFNTRILNEARDKSIPLLERLKFLGITASNLDEFFMVRVASLKDMVHADYKKCDISGLTATEQLEAINKEAKEFVSTQYSTYNRSLKPALKKQGIQLIDAYEDLTEEQGSFVDHYFQENVYPVLTPMAVDASRPFPLIQNKTLNIVSLLRTRKGGAGLHKSKSKKQELEFATIQVPSVLPRLVPIPPADGYQSAFILLEQIMEKNIDVLYLNYDVICSYPYRVMRNADLSFDEDDAADLLKEIEKQLKKRQWGEVIRLEVEETIDKRLLRLLKENLHVKSEDVFSINGPIDLTVLSKLFGLHGYDHLRYEPYEPKTNGRLLNKKDLFSELRKGDIFLHHPYESFEPVVNLIRQAAEDPDVLAIKQTLYRVSGNSPIIAALARAAENGKQVTVLVELKARFDEENNIVWAKKLEKAGCHVIYGIVGLKTHCKIALIVRREEDGIKRYVHLGTGNYNDSTAKLYTDCGLFTCSEAIGEDATAVFNMLSGYSEPKQWHKLIVAPIWMRKKFYALIDREITHAKNGQDAQIIAKMNSLCDKGIISKLYEASAAGVQIQLIVRGICCLKVGIPGVSDNIQVSSIVGNFLEHSRMFYFYNGGAEEVYMGSADWMPRNLDKRVEIIFPVEDARCIAKAKHILDIQLQDNLKAYYLKKDGSYVRLDKRGKKLCSAQKTFAMESSKNTLEARDERSRRIFTPIFAADIESSNRTEPDEE
ncbi:MAG: RNA degradosome polyphosphate kinase [Lachnospiraceae bacterium]|nr:RNA degradosome polyphosphate kinase [Lachnospiraceae bacterium]